MMVIGAIVAIEIGFGYLAMKTLNPANESSPIFGSLLPITSSGVRTIPILVLYI
jgi:hypothetical protein